MLEIARFLIAIGYRILCICSPEFRNVVSDIRLIAIIIFEAFAVYYASTYGLSTTSYVMNGIGIAGIIYALYFRWSNDTSGIDVGNLNDDNTRDYMKSGKKGKYDY